MMLYSPVVTDKLNEFLVEYHFHHFGYVSAGVNFLNDQGDNFLRIHPKSIQVLCLLLINRNQVLIKIFFAKKDFKSISACSAIYGCFPTE